MEAYQSLSDALNQDCDPNKLSGKADDIAQKIDSIKNVTDGASAYVGSVLA